MQDCLISMQNLMQTCCSMSSVILNATATHVLTQQHLPPSLTSSVRSSLFTHVPSSPLSLAARLHRCCGNSSCYINDGWTFSRQISNIRNPTNAQISSLYFLILPYIFLSISNFFQMLTVHNFILFLYVTYSGREKKKKRRRGIGGWHIDNPFKYIC